MQDEDLIPAAVDDLVQLAGSMVKEAIGIEPDLTPDTLPLVDQYLRQIPRDASDEIRDRVVAAVGCYFGEVARRHLDGRWTLAGAGPSDWRVELLPCFLYFCPAGMVREVLLGTKSDNHDGSFGTLAELEDGLGQMLAAAAPVSEEEYYSLSGRIDVLQLAADWLVGQRMTSGTPPRPCSPEDYSERLDGEDSPP
jgi:hypothetical protein